MTTVTDIPAQGIKAVIKVDPDSADRQPALSAPGREAVDAGIPTIAIEKLVGNPDNVRRDLRVDREFVESIRAEGIRVPLVLVRTDDGAYLVDDGDRRLVGAREAGLTHVPYVLDRSRARDAAGRFLDQVITSRHKAKLTELEEVDALFGAAQAGASTTRLAKAYGGRKKVATALTVAQLPHEARQAAARAAYPWTLDELALLDEFRDDAQATERLIAAAAEGTFAFQVERERMDRQEATARAERRAELVAAGVRTEEEPPEGAVRLWRLASDDARRLDETTHGSCPGHLAVVVPDSAAPRVDLYCADPVGHGHRDRFNTQAAGGAVAVAVGAEAAAATARVEAAASVHRRLVIRGNKDWRAARTARRAWLTSLFARKTLSKQQADQVARFVAETYLTMPAPMSKGADYGVGVTSLQAELLGTSNARAAWREIVAAAANPYRLTLLALAPIAASYEDIIAEGTWRTGRPAYYSGDRADAAAWLTFCVGLGHRPAAIERAVIDGAVYTPDTAPTGCQVEDGPASADDQAASVPEDAAESSGV